MRLLLILLLYTATTTAQSINIGITFRTIHRDKVSRATGEKYNNWNPGITIGYRAKNNLTFETGLVLNSYKKLTWVNAFGYRSGDWEIQIGGATGYKHIGQPWFRPGYFINYYADPFKIKINHEIINFGFTYEKQEEIYTNTANYNTNYLRGIDIYAIH